MRLIDIIVPLIPGFPCIISRHLSRNLVSHSRPTLPGVSSDEEETEFPIFIADDDPTRYITVATSITLFRYTLTTYSSPFLRSFWSRINRWSSPYLSNFRNPTRWSLLSPFTSSSPDSPSFLSVPRYVATRLGSERASAASSRKETSPHLYSHRLFLLGPFVHDDYATYNAHHGLK